MPGPTILDVFVFVVGASIAFATVNTLSSHRFSERLPDEPAVVVLLGTTFSVFSISAAVGVAVGIAYAIPGWPAWLVSSFAFAGVYLLVVGLELGLAAKRHELGGQGTPG